MDLREDETAGANFRFFFFFNTNAVLKNLIFLRPRLLQAEEAGTKWRLTQFGDSVYSGVALLIVTSGLSSVLFFFCAVAIPCDA